MKCACGCGDEIIPQKHHKRFGVPKYILGHNTNRYKPPKGYHPKSEFKKGNKVGHRFPKGNVPWNYKGGQIIDDGYVLISNPRHPFADSRGYVRLHRLIYETYKKCSILPYIVTHHINGNKQDNRIENLELMTRSQHANIHDLKRMY